MSNIFFEQQDKRQRSTVAQLAEASEIDWDQLLSAQEKEHWQARIDKVMAAGANHLIPRHLLAGKMVDGQLIMHNGIKVDPLSYYRLPMLKMLMENKGVHEPEEEYFFQEALKAIENKPTMTMIELGAYWAFYSMWFLSVFPHAHCYMIEPEKRNLYYGKKNFKLNKRQGKFIQAGIGCKNNTQGKFDILTVDEICQVNNIQYIDLLHADIQGAEFEMLQGCNRILDEKRLNYVFISTHSTELHEQCRNFLLARNFIEVANVNLDESSSWDGILVMKAK